MTKTNDDVFGFRADNKTIEYFPRGLEKFFKNLRLIEIYYCPIKEIYQSDLKSLSKLNYLNIYESDIEVLEEGLFDFNPELIVLGINGHKLIHIDPNVLDPLTNLMYFWFGFVPCFHENISNSKGHIKEGIQKVKSQCTAPEFLSWDDKIKNLENNIKISTFDDFREKLESFEQSFMNSKFSKFRPLKNKVKVLKSNLKCSNCAQFELISELDKKFDAFGANLVKNISVGFSNFDESQCGLKNNLNDLKASQDVILTSQSSAFDSLSNITSKINEFKATQIDTTNWQLDMKGSISDKSVLSTIKSSQNDAKNALINTKITQNELKVAVDEIKLNFEDKIETKLEIFDGKFENLEIQFAYLAEKFDKNQKDMNNKLHKISLNFDEKIKRIEKVIVKKIEEIMEKKLGKFLDEKLGTV